MQHPLPRTYAGNAKHFQHEHSAVKHGGGCGNQSAFDGVFRSTTMQGLPSGIEREPVSPVLQVLDMRQSRDGNIRHMHRFGQYFDGKHGHPREVRVSQREECRTDQSGGASADLIIHRGRFSGKLIAPYGLCSNAERQFRDDVSGVAA